MENIDKMQILISQLLDKYSFKRQNLLHQITTAMKLGFYTEAKHLQELRELTEDCGYDLKAISEQYEKEKTNPTALSA